MTPHPVEFDMYYSQSERAPFCFDVKLRVVDRS
jgi:hypothetical protein